MPFGLFPTPPSFPHLFCPQYLWQVVLIEHFQAMERLRTMPHPVTHLRDPVTSHWQAAI